VHSWCGSPFEVSDETWGGCVLVRSGEPRRQLERRPLNEERRVLALPVEGSARE